MCEDAPKTSVNNTTGPARVLRYAMRTPLRSTKCTLESVVAGREGGSRRPQSIAHVIEVAVRSLLAKFGSRLDGGTQGHPGERAADRDARNADLRKFGDGRRAGAGDD